MSLNRCDKLTREVCEKEESLAKARVDLAAELQASGAASIVPIGDKAAPIGVAPTPTSLSVFESLGLGHQARAIRPPCEKFDVREVSHNIAVGAIHENVICVFSLLLRYFQQAGSRVKTLEVKVATLTEERDSAKQNVRDAIHTMKAAAEDLRLKTKGITLTLFAEDSSRHAGLSEVRKA